MFSAAIFVLVFIVWAALAFMRSPMYGLALYLATIYVHPPSRWWASMLPDLRWAFIAGAIALAAVLLSAAKLDTGNRPWFRTVPGAALLIFVCWFWLQNLWALDSRHLEYSVQYTKYLIVFYIVYRLASSPQRTTDILLLHVAGCLLLGLLCLYHGRSFGARLDGVGGPGMDDANTLGMYLASGLAVGAVLLLELKGWRRILLLLALPIILNGVFYAGSRGAFLGMLAGGVVIFYLAPRGRRMTLWAGVALGIAAALILVDDKFVERMNTISTVAISSEDADASTQSRFALIEAQLKMAIRYPHGAGFRGTEAMSREYLDARWLAKNDDVYQAARSSHNTFMTALVEHGILGALLYCWLTVWGAISIFRIKWLQRRGAATDAIAPSAACSAGIVVVWIAGQFTDYLHAEVQFWLLAALAGSLEQLRRYTLTPGAASVFATPRSTALEREGAA